MFSYQQVLQFDLTALLFSFQFFFFDHQLLEFLSNIILNIRCYTLPFTCLVCKLGLMLLQPAFYLNLLDITFIGDSGHLPGYNSTALLSFLVVLVKVNTSIFIFVFSLVLLLILLISFV